MGQSGALGWVMVTIGVVLVVLGVLPGGITWSATILISLLGLALVGVGALIALRARRQSPTTSQEEGTPAPDA